MALISHEPTRLARNLMAAQHFTPLAECHNENNFMGFVSLALFTVVTVASPDILRTNIQAMGINDRRVFELAWNGDKSLTSTPTISGLSNASLTPNAAIDWGYDRPDWSVVIRPAAGFTPVIKALTPTAAAISVRGFSQFETIDVVFDGAFDISTTEVGYSCLTMYSAKGGTIQNMTGSPSFGMTHARTVHVDGLAFKNCTAGFSDSPQTVRIWNVDFEDMGASDVIALRGYDGAPTDVWTARLWIAGCFLFGKTYAGSITHQDLTQYSNNSERGQQNASPNFTGYSCLVEHNMMLLNGQASQGFFGDDGFDWDGWHVIVNNIIAVDASNGITISDFNDNMHKYVTGNILVKAPGTAGLAYRTLLTGPFVAGQTVTGGTSGASGTISVVNVWGATVGELVLTGVTGGPFTHNEPLTSVAVTAVANDPDQTPKMIMKTIHNVGTGSMYIGENIFADNATVGFSNTTNENNVKILKNNKGAILTGNGSFANQNETGTYIYDAPTFGLERAAAYTAAVAFYMPVGGWRVGGVGPADPAEWPVSPPETIGAGAPPVPLVMAPHPTFSITVG